MWNGTIPAAVTNSSKPLVGIWYHLAMTVSNSTIRLFVNGVDETKARYNSGVAPDGTTLNDEGIRSIGRFCGTSYGQYVNGILDEVRIYNRALTQTECQLLLHDSPAILSKTADQNLFEGTNVVLSVVALGEQPFRYQWKLAGTNIVGATNVWLTLSNVIPADAGEYSVVVTDTNELSTTATIQVFILWLSIQNLPDNDHDGIPDYWERRFGLNPNDPTDANNKPAGDALSYRFKYLYHLNPLTPDNDGDGLSDYDEIFVYGTNPLLTDTDGDGIPDGWEVQYGLNPRFNDASLDLDQDGLTNLEEYQWTLTHPSQPSYPNQICSGTNGLSDYELVKGGVRRTAYRYDKIDRLVGADYHNGLAIAYQYDGNGNIRRQLMTTQAVNGVSASLLVQNKLTNGASGQGLYEDADGDGFSNYQEILCRSNPLNAMSTPKTMGIVGSLIATQSFGFYPSNFIMAVGDLDGITGDEIIVGARGDAGPVSNVCLVRYIGSTLIATNLEVGPYQINSVAYGRLSVSNNWAFYLGLSATGGVDSIMEISAVNGAFMKKLIPIGLTNQEVYVIGAATNYGLAIYLPDTNLYAGKVYPFCLQGSNFVVQSSWSYQDCLETPSLLQPAAFPNLKYFHASTNGALGFSGDSGQNALLAYYPFDASPEDKSGNSRNAALVASPAFAAGKYGQAISLDGNSQYIKCPITNIPASLTVSMWVNLTRQPSGNFEFFGAYETNHGAITLQYRNVGGPSVLRSDIFSGTDVIDEIAYTLTNGTWYHVAMTLDDYTRTVRIFVNGAMIREANNRPRPSGSTAIINETHIGASYNGAYCVPGLIDDVKIYGTALSPEQVNAIYRQTFFASNNTNRLTNPVYGLPMRGQKLTSGLMRGSLNPSAMRYLAIDSSLSGQLDDGDSLVLQEFEFGSTNQVLRTLQTNFIVKATLAQSIGLTVSQLPGQTNGTLFSAEPDGRLFSWNAEGTNALKRELFSIANEGSRWEILSGWKTIENQVSLLGLRSSTNMPGGFELVSWPLNQANQGNISDIMVAPITRILDAPNAGGAVASLQVRIWDADGSPDFLDVQYQPMGASNWFAATLVSVNGLAPAAVATHPNGVLHQVVWNAAKDLGVGSSNAVWLRVRGRDNLAAGGWSVVTPYAVVIPHGAPIAVNDTVSTLEDVPVTIFALTNDVAGSNGIVLLADFSQPAHGLVATNSNQSFNYLPLTNYFGNDSFTYTITDGLGNTSMAAVAITVQPVNDPPFISAISNLFVPVGANLDLVSFTIGDVDNDVSTLTIMVNSDNQGLIPNDGIVSGGTGANRNLRLTQVPNQTGTATITVSVSDGQTNAAASFTVNIFVPNTPPTIALVAPTNGSLIAGPTNLVVSANATDADGNVSQVQFYAINLLLGTSNFLGSVSQPSTNNPQLYSATWTNAPEGQYRLGAWATDNLGATMNAVEVGMAVLYLPQIVLQPQGMTTNVGGSAGFSVLAASTSPLAYQWQFNGANIIGSTNAVLNLGNVDTNRNGNYRVLVQNAAGTVASSNAPLVVLNTVIDNTVYHSADTNRDWMINGSEVNRVLSYWRSSGYHVDTNGLDGYAAGPGDTNGVPHKADYNRNWVISGTEVNRVLGYWRIGGYHVDTNGLDGYAPGAASQSKGGTTNSGAKPAMATVIFKQAGPEIYPAKQSMQITNTLNFQGQLLALLWRPILPSGWQLVSVSADGKPELMRGEVVWTGIIPPSPIALVYTVSVPAGEIGVRSVLAEIEYQYGGEANPFAQRPDQLDLAHLKLKEMLLNRNGRFEFNIAGQSGTKYEVETSPDLVQWQPVSTVTNVNGSLRFVDEPAVTNQNRYYRLNVK